MSRKDIYQLAESLKSAPSLECRAVILRASRSLFSEKHHPAACDDLGRDEGRSDKKSAGRAQGRAGDEWTSGSEVEAKVCRRVEDKRKREEQDLLTSRAI